MNINNKLIRQGYNIKIELRNRNRQELYLYFQI